MKGKTNQVALGNTASGAATEERHAATPGPWKVLKAAGGWIETAGNPYGRGSMHIADTRGWGHLTGRGGGCAFSEAKAIAIQDANAQLIAAAPELLEACRRVAEWLSSFSMPPTSTIAEKETHLALLEAVIEKAEGRE